ncbi:MAG: hypothetical protein A2355_06805, partial [Spirochaetes bacterium RIFOXYB1_FULL_32_8]
FIIDEFEKSGIKDILIVTSRRKKSLEDYFDKEIELETVFNAEENISKLESIKTRDLNIFFTRQMEMKGTGHAIMTAKAFVAEEPFIIAYPDDLVFSDIPLSKQLIDIYNKTGGSVLAVEEVSGDVSRYGVIKYSKQNDLLKVEQIIEKPAKGTEPSQMISVGRYLFTPELFKLLEKDYANHSKGEFYHINAINSMATKEHLFACQYTGKRIDVGDKLGYFEGIIRYALMRDDLKSGAEEILKNIYKNL